MLQVLNGLALVLAVMFVTYVVLILVPFLRHPKGAVGPTSAFNWHVFIPCRDEEAVISNTIARARKDFPYAHVWIIDDDSQDATASIVNLYAESDSHVHLVQRRAPNARLGKGKALNAAYDALNTWSPAGFDRSSTIIAVVDADGELDPSAFEAVAAADVFGTEKVGAAQITVWMKNRDDKRPFPEKNGVVNWFASMLVRMQDIEFRTIISGMQSLRTRTGTVGLGGNGQFTRLSTLDAIAATYGEPWHGSLLEDYELGVHVLLAGYEIKHVAGSHVSQEGLPSVQRLLTQRTRWAQGNIECVKYLKQMFTSVQLDNAGVVESSYYLLLPFLQLAGMIAFVSIGLINVVEILQNPNVLIENLPIFLGLFALSLMFAVGPFAVWGFVYRAKCEPSASYATALLWGIGVWVYVYYMYAVLPRAFFRIATGKSGWAKTRRNAETQPLGVTALES